MRRMSELALSALAGSQTGVRLVADVWRGGRLLTDTGPLPVESWQVGWDATRQVQGQASLTVADPDGTLAPWAPEDMLGAGGSRLHLRYQMPDVGPTEEVSLGWFRIVTPDTEETWRIHPTAGVWVSGGATIDLTAHELTWQAKAETFLAPESPRFTGSVFTEVRRLLDGIMPLGSTLGVDDGPVPAAVAYSLDRMDAVEDLLASVRAVHRMSGDGLLELLPTAPGASVWTIGPAQGGEQGVLVQVSRSQNAGDLPNAAAVDGATTDGVQVVGRAFQQSGPLAFGGPHGRIPARMSSPLMDTQAKADAAAATYLQDSLGGRRTVLPVVCLPHPGLQMHDVVDLITPVGTLSGPVVSMSLAGDRDGVRPMNLGVSVHVDQLAQIATALRLNRG